MLFNSLEFAIFLPIVFTLYWLIPTEKIKLQNILLLVASYIFYGWWDYRFLSLLIFSTLVDYIVGLALYKTNNERKRKMLLLTSLTVNLGLLGFFKYYNFFVDNFIKAFSFFGYKLNARTLDVILPVGISFYTFQTLSYSIDIYRRKMKPTKSFIDFAAFVSFFPQLVAGPIERASNLLPQFEKRRKFDYHKAVDGLKQITWGLFKKMVIADNCAVFVNKVFAAPNAYNGSSLLLGAIFFAFQIYGDFSGYSDIAIGTAKLFDFDLMRNFAYPYFSRDIAEFWRRWHISLSTWFRDYVYIPLGGSRVSKLKAVRNTFIIFVVSGFWHGANWTFIFWGLLNALYFIPLLLTGRNRKNLEIVAKGRLFPSISELTGMVTTFLLTLFAWIFFRAQSIHEAFKYISRMLTNSLFTVPDILITSRRSILTLLLIILLITIEWIGREQDYPIRDFLKRRSKILRWMFYYVVVLSIIVLQAPQQQVFIYFQF